jgi:two-component system, chemotaxis family, chemotaxis protein CheY
MKMLIVEDDFTSRVLLQELLRDYGPAHVAANGGEAITAVRESLQAGDPYELICLDIMMPEVDGQTTLRAIRTLEDARGIRLLRGAKIVMTTSLADMTNVMESTRLCNGYLVKPIDHAQLHQQLATLGLIPRN